MKVLEQYQDNAPSRWAVYPLGKTWFMANGRLYAMAALATFDTEEEAKAFVARAEGRASK